MLVATNKVSATTDADEVPSSAARPAVDIIVPVYKSPDLTSRCLSSLAEHIGELGGQNPRLIVINDSPGDADVQVLLEEFAGRHSCVELLKNERNVGFVATVNRGLANAGRLGRDVILVNADTETFAGTLTNLADAAYADEQIGFVSPRSNNASLCSLPHVRGGTLADPVEAHRQWRALSRTMPPFHFTPTAVGFYLYIKRAVIANFGLLDSEFGIGYEEENDLIMRANKVGYRAALANNAFAYHAGSASFRLLEMNLPIHQSSNLKKMAERHPDYLPLVRRYEASAHYRAERLLSQALPFAGDPAKVVFDLSTVGVHFNGTSEMAMSIIDGFCRRHAARFDLSVICSPDALKFHHLDRYENLRRLDPDAPVGERFAIGIQFGQPFTMHSINVLEDLALVNIFGMLDTIAEDCGQLAITHQLQRLWGHVSRHASGFFFNSKFAERCVLTRYPDAELLPRYARLLPTRLSSYLKPAASKVLGEHVLILGNQFEHKGSDVAAGILMRAFPTIQFVVLGRDTAVNRNLRAYRSGSLSVKQMESLYQRASIVVLPSHVEGFGFGLVHALAAGKVVVARDIPATREILATYRRVSGVFLYADDEALVPTLQRAMAAAGSQVDDQAAEGWEDWVDGFADFCYALLASDDLFGRVVRRIYHGDLIRQAAAYEFSEARKAEPPGKESIDRVAQRDWSEETGMVVDSRGREWRPLGKVGELLALNGAEFICAAYVTLFKRFPDAEGLENYLNELSSGVPKLQIITRLKTSPEGRRIGAPLSGYTTAIARKRLAGLVGDIKRVTGEQ